MVLDTASFKVVIFEAKCLRPAPVVYSACMDMSQSLSGPIRPAPTGQGPRVGSQHASNQRYDERDSLRKHFAADHLQR